MSLFTELKRRKVFRVAVVYAATAFVVLQAADIMLPRLAVPEWAMTLVVVFAVLGFPIALVLAWALELTPDGVKVTSPRDAASTDDPPPSLLGKRTALAAAALVILGIGLGAGWFLRPQPVAPTPTVADESAELPAAIERSIAVLAFDNMSPDPDNAFFAEGISEEILNLLASVERLSVASRTSAFSYRGKDVPIPEIAAQLGVRYVLEGSVRRAGAQVRITAQLIDAATDRHLWSANYDRTLADVFAVQDEIAAAIGQALQVALLGPDGETVTATEIAPELYEKFLQSRFLIRQRSPAALARATALLEEVVEGEPRYAPGLAQLAEARLVASGSVDVDRLPHHLDHILELVDRALSIDPRLAGAFAVRGNVAMARGEQVEALHDYQRAIELDPDDPRPHHWLAILYSEAGHLDLAERAIAESLRLDPENANAEAYRAHLLAARGRWDEAGASARRVVELGNPVGHTIAANYLLAADPRENLDRAESELRLALAKGAPPGAVPLKVIAFARGDDAALESLVDDVRHHRIWFYLAAEALLVLEQHDALLLLLERQHRAYDWTMPRVWAPEHAALRRDPRFLDYLRRQGGTDLWREIGLPPDCRADGDTYVCGLEGEAAHMMSINRKTQ